MGRQQALEAWEWEQAANLCRLGLPRGARRHRARQRAQAQRLRGAALNPRRNRSARWQIDRRGAGSALLQLLAATTHLCKWDERHAIYHNSRLLRPPQALLHPGRPAAAVASRGGAAAGARGDACPAWWASCCLESNLYRTRTRMEHEQRKHTQRSLKATLPPLTARRVAGQPAQAREPPQPAIPAAQTTNCNSLPMAGELGRLVASGKARPRAAHRRHRLAPAVTCCQTFSSRRWVFHESLALRWAGFSTKALLLAWGPAGAPARTALRITKHTSVWSVLLKLAARALGSGQQGLSGELARPSPRALPRPPGGH